MADYYCADVNTTGLFVEGGISSGELEFVSDRDWRKVFLTASTSHTT